MSMLYDMKARDSRLAELNKKLDAKPNGLIYDRVSDLKLRPIEWLWPNRIARGKVTLIAGHPGLGKSQISASLVAITTTGGRWPVDRSTAPKSAAIILSAEDDPADTIGPRLVAAGADITRTFVVRAVHNEDGNGREVQRTFDLGRDIAHLGEMIRDVGEVGLVIIDPITAYVGNIDSHRTSDVRGLMAPLSELAEHHRVAIVAISHLRKQAGEALMSVTGSLAFVAAARAAYIVAKDPENDRRRLLLPAKNNVGDDKTGLSYTIESALVGEGIPTSQIMWGSELVTASADDVLGRSFDAQKRMERNDAAVWLRSVLADGPVSTKDLQREAKGAGYSWSTIKRAKTTAGAVADKSAFDGGWRWSLSTNEAKLLSADTDGPLRVENAENPSSDAEFCQEDHVVSLSGPLRESVTEEAHVHGTSIFIEEDHQEDQDNSEVVFFDETRFHTGILAATEREGDQLGVAAPLDSHDDVASF